MQLEYICVLFSFFFFLSKMTTPEKQINSKQYQHFFFLYPYCLSFCKLLRWYEAHDLHTFEFIPFNMSVEFWQ